MALIPRLSDIPRGDSVTQLIYGPSGTGKTDYLGTCGDRTLYFECENRLATIQGEGFKKRRGNWNPIIYQIHEDFMPDAGAQALDKIALTIKEADKNFKDQFDIIAIDGATAFNRFAMNKGLELNQKLSKSKTKEVLDRLGSGVDPTSVAVQDYGIQMTLVENFILQVNEYVRKEKKHFIMTAHERISFKEKSNPTALEVIDRIRPGFSGRTFPDSIPGMFDMVWYFEVVGSGEQSVYRAVTEGDRALVAKTCFNGLFPIKVVNPNFLDIVRKIQESK